MTPSRYDMLLKYWMLNQIHCKVYLLKSAGVLSVPDKIQEMFGKTLEKNHLK